MVKNLPALQETQDPILGWEIPWIRKWQPTQVFLPRRIPWTKELGRLQSIGSHSWTQIEFLFQVLYILNPHPSFKMKGPQF